MSFVQRELIRIKEALRPEVKASMYDKLYVAQQTLEWVLEPNGIKAPYNMIMGTPAKPEDCSDESRPPQSSSICGRCR